MTARAVYGEPVVRGAVTVIPAARLRGGAGGGGGRGPDGEGQGTGFGLVADPAGAWVLTDDAVRWRPAVNVNRVKLGWQLVALAAVLVAGRVLLARAGR